MKKIKPAYLIGIVVILILAALSFYLLDGHYAEIQAKLSTQELQQIAIDDSAKANAIATGKTLGIITLIPAILTVILAFVTKEVVFSLFVGILSGYIILESTSGVTNFISHILDVFQNTCHGILSIASDGFNVAIIISCLAIGGVVSVANASGGFAALGEKLTKNIKTPKGALFSTQIMGIMLFFDDYANSLILGPIMRPITDKQGVSREKLAYVVDSTAAPVAGIAIVSSWIAAELSAIEGGFEVAGIHASAYSHFLGSIPYCFYNLLAIAFVFIIVLMGRDYGPMYEAECRGRSGETLKKDSRIKENNVEENVEKEPGSIWSIILPVLALVGYCIFGFYFDGLKNAIESGTLQEGVIFSFKILSVAYGNADTVNILMQAAIFSSIVAIFMGCVTGKLNLVSGVAKWLDGASEILLTAVILILAWTLSNVISEIGTAYFLVDVITMNLPYWVLPMLIFITCCAISFASGSFGCIVIVMPMAVPLAYSIVANAGISYGNSFIYASIAAVISGAIFGDHCSPVTDTTILSSLGAGCNNLDHVKTQLPYALTVAAAASIFGFLPAGLGVSPLISVAVGILVLLIVVRFLGKIPKQYTISNNQ